MGARVPREPDQPAWLVRGDLVRPGGRNRAYADVSVGCPLGDRKRGRECQLEEELRVGRLQVKGHRRCAAVDRDPAGEVATAGVGRALARADDRAEVVRVVEDDQGTPHRTPNVLRPNEPSVGVADASPQAKRVRGSAVRRRGEARGKIRNELGSFDSPDAPEGGQAVIGHRRRPPTVERVDRAGQLA